MRELEAGTIGKIKDRELTPEQKKTLEVTAAVDYLFESIIYGKTYSGNEETMNGYAQSFIEAIKDKYLNLEDFKANIEERIRYSKFRTGKETDNIEKAADTVLECLQLPREDLPLLINERDNAVVAIVNARIKYGED